MCGISGWFNLNGVPVDQKVLHAMTDVLIHRGPDDSGLWVDGAIGLGHRRLSIRDLSAAARQPMSDPSSRVVVTYNGEIYNDIELRQELERDFGVYFRTTCDTELLPAGYLAWGDALFERLEGMFAIGLWDSARRRLVLARDGIGIKPLYYHASLRTVLFGSEIKSLLANPIVQKTVDCRSLHTFLAAGHPGPTSSLITGVAQVRQGTMMAFTSTGVEEKQFWRPRRTGEINNLDSAVEEFGPLWHNVVQSQLVSDVPLGVLQSGGIDSTLVSLSLRGRHPPVPLFTAGFRETSHDESGLATLVAKSAGLPHYLLQVEDDLEPTRTFQAIVHHFDGNSADTGSYPFYRLCGEVGRQTKVVLSGDGGDEFFGGYDTYVASRVADHLRPFLPSSALEMVGRLTYRLGSKSEKRLPLAAIVSRFMLGLARADAYAHVEWRRLLPHFMMDRLYGPALRPFLHESPFHEYEALMASTSGDLLDKCLLADQQFHLPSILAKVDALSMAHSLEIRVPLLDRRIMDFAGRCSTDILVPWKGPRKLLLRGAAARLGAPRNVLQAGKLGFNSPIARLLRSALSPLAEEYFERCPEILQPYLRADGVRELWRAHKYGRANHAFALWPILILAVWLGDPGKCNPLRAR